MKRALGLISVVIALLSGVGACGKPPSTLTLSWNPPSKDTSGQPLEDLKGYRIVFGSSSKHYTGVIVVNDAHATQYVVRGLARGHYFFAVSAYSASGAESSLSPEVAGDVK